MALGTTHPGHRLLRVVLACSAAIASAVTAADASAPVAGSGVPALEFQGLALGSSTADARRHFRYLRCRPDVSVSPTADTVCIDDLQARCHPPQAFRIPAEHPECAQRLASLRTYAGAELTDVRLYFLHGRLLQVELGFPSAAFDTVVDALIGRYGTPGSNDSGEIRNRFGASFRDTQARWTLPDGRISVSRRSSDFSRGTMSLVSGDQKNGARLLLEQDRRPRSG
jgi:hypothetical protein